jgi:hypothetical protein
VSERQPIATRLHQAFAPGSGVGLSRHCAIDRTPPSDCGSPDPHDLVETAAGGAQVLDKSLLRGTPVLDRDGPAPRANHVARSHTPTIPDTNWSGNTTAHTRRAVVERKNSVKDTGVGLPGHVGRRWCRFQVDHRNRQYAGRKAHKARDRVMEHLAQNFAFNPLAYREPVGGDTHSISVFKHGLIVVSFQWRVGRSYPHELCGGNVFSQSPIRAGAALVDLRCSDLRLGPCVDAGHARKAGTLGQYLIAFRLLLDHVGLEENVARDPRVKLPKQIREEPQPPSKEHFEAIVEALGKKWKLLFVTIEQGALRLGEAVNLRWADVDAAGLRLRLPPSATKRDRARWVLPARVAHAGERGHLPA